MGRSIQSTPAASRLCRVLYIEATFLSIMPSLESIVILRSVNESVRLSVCQLIKLVGQWPGHSLQGSDIRLLHM